MEITKKIKIAIDGPVASGKSTGAFLLAKELDVLYVNTGAMYRAVGWLAIEKEVDLHDEKKVVEILKNTEIRLEKPEKSKQVCDVYIDGKEIADQLFSSSIDCASSVIAVHPKVRKYLVNLQQKIAEGQSVVMEGRDIGTVVLPNADFKIYMTADPKVRAKRKWQMLKKKGETKSLDEVLKDVKERDRRDKNKGGLKKAKDAWVLDTSNLTLEEEIEIIIKRLKKMDLVKTNG